MALFDLYVIVCRVAHVGTIGASSR